MRAMKVREKFRAILAGNRVVIPASIMDPATARMAEQIGYEAMILAGSTTALSVFGGPDEGVLTATEMAELVRRICRAVEIPLFVDADNGFGNAINMMRTMEELETAGAAAVKFSDVAMPLPFGTDGKERLVSLEEAAGKYKAAVAARADKSLAIIARTHSLAREGLDQCVARIKAYEAAGVDGLFFIGLRDRTQLDALANAVKIPILCGARTPELTDNAYLASRRVKINHLGNAPVNVAVQSVYTALKQILDTGSTKGLQNVASSELMDEVTGRSRYGEAVGKFLA